MEIKYELYNDSHLGLEIADGFFDGWYKKISKNIHREIMKNSYKCVVAICDNKIIGFANAISDGVISAYIPLIEVVKEYQGQGIGTKIFRKLIEELGDIYMIDLSCDDDVIKFYEKFEMIRANAMCIRNY